MFRDLLQPFRRDYAKYLSGTVVRQALLVLGGYSMVWAMRICLAHRTIPEWWLIIALVVFDSLFLGLDISLNSLYTRRLSFPLFARLRTSALRKVFDMPLQWHQQQTSGALVAKVNNGVGRVVQTAEALSRELCPSLIRTCMTLVPLLIFGLATAPVLLVVLLIFGGLTFCENKRRAHFRKDRYEKYVRDSGVFSEYVQSVQPVVQFGQCRRILSEYQGLQQQIVDQGLAEMEVGNRFAWWKNTALSIAKRVCQGIWIWQLRRGR